MIGFRRVFGLGMILLAVPMTANAGKVRIVGGGFEFVHAPVNPMPENPDLCFGPQGEVLGLRFSVTGTSFNTALETSKKEFQLGGAGAASGCAFFEPICGVAAQFSGSVTWQTAEGDQLHGTFELFDFPTDNPIVFEAIIFIRFEGGTGVFKNAEGTAIAEGVDLPFGGLGGYPSAAGVAATFVCGEIKLKN